MNVPDFFPVPCGDRLIQGPWCAHHEPEGRHEESVEIRPIGTVAHQPGDSAEEFPEDQEGQDDLLGDMPSDAEGLKGPSEVATLFGNLQRR